VSDIDPAQSRQIKEYILAQVIRRRGVTIENTTRLVSSGLIDSLALVDILLKLEEVTNLRIPAGKVGAKDMDTIELMFATAERVGKPRKKK
jgi:acyl carrier protein